MLNLNRRNPVVTAGLLAALLAVAAPAGAGAAVGHPADSQAVAVARDASTSESVGGAAHVAPGPLQLQDVDTEI
jgi:hypothetical protein